MDDFIGFLIVVGIVIYIVVSVIQHYPTQIVFILLLIAAAIIARKLYKAAERRRAAEAEKKRNEESRIQLHKSNQEGYRRQIMKLGDESISHFESLPEMLHTADNYLKQAEFEYSDGAFAPFWDAIENAAKTLGRFDESIRKIQDHSSQYSKLIDKYEETPPQFPVACESIEKLSIGTSIAENMRDIVRKAQRNFQFATIYEQRKTNQILVAGFTNLAHALEQMTFQLTESIRNLACSVDSMAFSMNDSMIETNAKLSNMADINVRQHKDYLKIEEDRAAREKKVLTRLDNIQHHRKPLI